MEKKQISGEYLAPEVKVVGMQTRQTVLTGSPTNVSNPFGGGSEQEW